MIGFAELVVMDVESQRKRKHSEFAKQRRKGLLASSNDVLTPVKVHTSVSAVANP